MSKRKEDLSTQEQREQLKQNKMEYAYQATSELGKLPILGSLIRAIGKGWSVCVVVDNEMLPQFIAFQEQLKNKNLMLVVAEDQAKTINFAPYQLVLFEGVSSELLTEIRNSPKVLGKTNVMAVEDNPSDEYDLISDFSKTEINEVGVTAITGPGKGKTTSALGLAAQALGEGKKVAVIQWFKERKAGNLTWAINEHQFPDQLVHPDLLQFYPTGLGFFGSPNMDRVKGEQSYSEHRQKAYEGLELAKHAISSGDFGLIVLDELIDTVKEIAQNIEYPLIDLPDIQQFLTFCSSQNTPVVVTGRRVSLEWSQFIGSSIVISEIKHPWSSKRKGAISGLDF